MVGLVRQRRAFTLIELLIVIAIFAILMSLLAAGVQRVREIANQTVCRNNLRQIGLAYNEYRNDHGAFPPLAISEPSRPTGWAPFILPYVEQDALAKQYNAQAPFYDSANQAVIRTRLKLFQCPSAPSRTASQDPYSASIVTPEGVTVSWEASPSDYTPLRAVGIILLRSDACAGDQMKFPKNLEGALLADKRRLFTEITDGASNTILVVEVAGRPQLWQAGRNTGTLVDANSTGFGGWGDGFSIPTFYGSSSDGKQSPGICGINCSNAFGLYSFHTGGAFCVFVDASVHYLSIRLSLHDSLIPLITANGDDTIKGDY